MELADLIVDNVWLSNRRVCWMRDQRIFQLEERSLLIWLVHFEIESSQVVVLISIHLAVRRHRASVVLPGVLNGLALTLTCSYSIKLLEFCHVCNLLI